MRVASHDEISALAEGFNEMVDSLRRILAETTAIGTFVTMACVSWTYDNIAMLWGILISFVVSMVVRGLMKNPIPTGVFLVVAPAAWGLFHLSIVRAGLIAVGASLVARAVMPKGQAKPDAV